MKGLRKSYSRCAEQRGAVLVLVTLLVIALLGFAALAVDIGHMAVVKNELQNAADAGALAGAAQLYYRDQGYPVPENPGDIGRVNPGANAAAELTAEKNSSVNVAVEVVRSGDNGGDAQRGHWSFWERKFYPLDTLEPIDVGSYNDDQLDRMDGQGGNLAFVNAVRVVAHRKETLAPAFFSKILVDIAGFEMESEAIAYLGYGGSFEPGDFDWPISICEESILDPSGNYQCGQVRLINSSSQSTSNTGGWTNYSAGCADNVSAQDIKSIFYYNNQSNMDCDGSNTNFIDGSISVGGGEVQVSFDDMMGCGDFDNSGLIRDQPWKLTLPVVDCDGTPGSGTMTGGPIGGCYQVTGAVTIEVVLITRTFPNNEANKYDDLPPKMGDWTNPNNPDGVENWKSFVSAFDLHVNGVPATSASGMGFYEKTIYARPTCEKVAPSGKTGGINTGVMAEVPVLVKGSINY